ncbi:hypothetical protein J4216_06250 [Candidatus Woesearchaeota archaeon]|nr:hypothetical protein [Candidatus Woesearchaeota archaeon]
MKATIFVHPGYLTRQDLDMSTYRDNPEYGDYEAYLGDLKDLFRATEREKRVLVVERIKRDGKITFHPYHEGFNPGFNDIVLEHGDYEATPPYNRSFYRFDWNFQYLLLVNLSKKNFYLIF